MMSASYSRGPQVVLMSPHGHMPNRRATDNASARRITSWIVRSIILATTGFALLDLSLLVSSVHH